MLLSHRAVILEATVIDKSGIFSLARLFILSHNHQLGKTWHYFLTKKVTEKIDLVHCPNDVLKRIFKLK